MTIPYNVKDASGKVVRFGYCLEADFSKQAMTQGETVFHGLPPEEPPQPLLADNYWNNRFKSYPPVGAQLDALYHAMDAGQLPKVAGFYDAIKAVKQLYPKT